RCRAVKPSSAIRPINAITPSALKALRPTSRLSPVYAAVVSPLGTGSGVRASSRESCWEGVMVLLVIGARGLVRGVSHVGGEIQELGGVPGRGSAQARGARRNGMTGSRTSSPLDAFTVPTIA